MSRRTIVIVVIVLMALTALSFSATELWVAPGHPSPGHRAFAEDCFACHRPFRGTPAALCTDCHAFDRASPVEANGKVQPGTPWFDLHREFTGRDCTGCHVAHLTRDTPTSTPHFDHRAYFPLDPPHDAECKTCHVSASFRSYSCTNCHEHSPSRLAREHAEEGIRNLDNCVRCHRSGHDDDD